VVVIKPYCGTEGGGSYWTSLTGAQLGLTQSGYYIAIIRSMKVSVAEAKNKLTQLLQAVEKGERVTICRHGKPIADLVHADEAKRLPPKFGTLKGKIKILDPNWAAPQNDIEAWLKGDV
jgi:prevent-host-death family protein